MPRGAKTLAEGPLSERCTSDVPQATFFASRVANAKGSPKIEPKTRDRRHHLDSAVWRKTNLGRLSRFKARLHGR